MLKGILIFAIFNLYCVFSATVKYQISVALLTPHGRNIIKESESTLEVYNIRTSSSLEFKVKSVSSNIIKHNSDNECQSCTFVLEFKAPGEKTFYSSIDSETLRNKKYEDFLEVALSETSEIMSIKYGVIQYIDADESQTPTMVKQIYIQNAKGSPNLLEELEVSNSKPGEEPIKVEKEQSFFQKYFWYIIIGGFVVYQFMSIDKDKLNDAMNQAQNMQGRGR